MDIDPSMETSSMTDGIAIIGMSGRFPKAHNLDQFWQNLLNGVEGIRPLTDEEVARVVPEYDNIKDDPDYVAARGLLDDVDMFDATFFGINPREARSMDPQQRIWFETAWHALENAGYAPSKYDGAIGVFAGSFMNSYLLYNLMQTREKIEGFVKLQSHDAFMNMLNNERDYLPTRTSYLFNLRGPSINVQTACSTSLVAVAQASQSLLNYESDICLAGGVTLFLPQERGYFYQEGGMLSSDGHCRPFDSKASGTVFSSGVGCVILKRLDDAIEDGDNILAVVKGAALNNDGAFKASYTAPSVDGQADVIAMAQAIAGVEPETISYIEAHGTATPLGDPIEIAGLTKAFAEKTDKKQFCAIGAVKSNIGHLDAAAGVAGLIKTVLSLQNETIPPTLHFEQANSEIDFTQTPFYVASEPTPWPRTAEPRRAGVSSFGVGGTNAHAVLEEAPLANPSSESRPRQLLLLSAKTETALEKQAGQLADALEQNELNLADVAFTLNFGRTNHNHRQILVAANSEEAITQLHTAKGQIKQQNKTRQPSVVFLFPGQGSQHVHMGRELYENEFVFKDAIDQCADILLPLLEVDLRDLLYPEGEDEFAAEILKQTGIAQPAIFSVEYALAQLWHSWGIQPDVMVGHSVGEITAACLAGVFSLADALTVLANRAKLMQDLPSGGMRAVRLTPEDLQPYLVDGICLAAVNSPGTSIVAGPHKALDAFDAAMAERELDTIKLHTSHAFHSTMMEPVLESFAEIVASVERKAPTVPIVSTVTGTWLTDEQAMSPNHWVQQLVLPVLYSNAVKELQKEPNRVLLEVGPSKNLSSAAQQHVNKDAAHIVIDSLGHAKKNRPALAATLEALGRLWMAGVPVDWDAFYGDERRHRIPLPGYPFERERYWIDPPPLQSTQSAEISVAKPSSNGQVYENGHALEALPSMVVAEPTPVATPAPPLASPEVAAMNRKNRIQEKLRHILYDLSGIEIEPANDNTSFMELGYDSLTLTQISSVFKSEFGKTIRFRRLLEDVSDLNALTDYFSAELPADQFADPAPQPIQAPIPAVAAPSAPVMQQPVGLPPAPARSSALAGSDDPVRELIEQQLEVMRQQLVVLSGGTPATASQPAAAPVQPTSAAPSTHSGKPKRRWPKAPKYKSRSNKSVTLTNMSKSEDGGLTPRQEAHLKALIAKLEERTKNSKAYAMKYRHVQAGQRNISGFRKLWKEAVYQVVMERSKGSRMWDVDGNEYIDMTMGFGVNLLGHSPDFITHAVKEQLDKGVELCPQSPLAGEVAMLIQGLTGVERVSFTNTGSEAVMGAIRLARLMTGNDKVVYFSGDYHGMFDEALARPQVMKDELRTMPSAPGITMAGIENIVVLEYGDPGSLQFIRDHIDELAAVIIEPVQSRYPENRPKEFVHEVRKITAENDVALVFDEVITGFRTHPGGMQHIYGVEADMVTYGKIVGGGMPIGILGGKAKYLDGIDGGMWQYGDDSVPEASLTFFAGTFMRHPAALAAARAMLNYLIEEGPGLQDYLNNRTTQLANELNQFFAEAQVPIKIIQYSSWFRFELPKEYQYSQLMFYHLLNRGIYVRTTAQNYFVSTAHSDEDLARVVQAIKASVRDMQMAGFFPGPDTAPFPLTEGQQEIWLASQLSPNASCAYNEAFTIRLRGDVDYDALLAAAETVIKRHSALHMRFSPFGEWQQRAESLDFDLPLLDWKRLNAFERDQQLHDIIEQEARTPFDLEFGPLFRARIVEFGPDETIFYFMAHHIVFDGWSTGLFVDELREAYSTLAQNRRLDWKAARSYKEYVDAEANLNASGEGRQALQFWLDQYKTLPPTLDLPADRARPKVKSYGGATLFWEFDEEVVTSVRQAAASERMTLYTMLLSAYSALLYQQTGQSDFVIGIPIAGQLSYGMEQLVGNCLSILPLRMQLDGGMSFRQLLAQTKSQLLDAQEHQNTTFGAILRNLNVPRDTSRSPLVDVIFNLDRKVEGKEFHGLESAYRDRPKQAINWDMFLNLLEERDTIVTNFDYNTDIWDESSIVRLLEQYEELLEMFAENPNMLLDALPRAQHDEKQLMVGQLNTAQTAFPLDRTVIDLFTEQAVRTPNAIAVIAEDATLTYFELDRKANMLANYLVTSGVEAETLVGVSVTRSAEMMVALLGIMKAGGAYVPLDPNFPQDRLAYMIQDANIEFLITQADYANDLPAHRAQVIQIDAHWDDISEHLPTAPSLAKADQLAYVIYTSGSTGKPKGVMVPHRPLTNFLLSMQQEPGLTDKDVMVGVTTLSFDIAGLELFLPLITGARVAVASTPTTMSGRDLQALLESVGATVMQATPATWKMLLHSGWEGRAGMKMLCGGEPLSRRLADALLARGGELWNMYGPTETTIWSTISQIRGGNTPITIGKPIANTSVLILDEYMRPAPVGTVGELYIGGEGVTRGYLNRDDLTGAAFIKNPIADLADSSGIIYKTGDLARFNPDSTIECLGRIDHQIKIRGFRVELGEIEAILTQHPSIEDAVCVVHDYAQAKNSELEDKRIVAYVISNQKVLDNRVLRDHLMKQLPHYMLPAFYVKVDDFPTTPNGKIDRNALPKPEKSRNDVDVTMIAPRNAIEQTVAEMWSNILHIDRVGTHDDFFELGGHSLLAARVLARIHDQLQVNIPLLTFFENPTVSALAKQITMSRWMEDDTHVSGEKEEFVL